MDPVTQMIVDLLRKKQETQALNQGGPMAGAQSPMITQGQQPLHDGKSYEDIIASMSQ